MERIDFRPIDRSQHEVLVVDDEPASRYATVRLLRNAGISAERCSLLLGDARGELPIAAGSCSWMALAEILEHIPDPGAALREARRCLRPGAPLFISTTVEGDAIDHLYLFERVEDVRALLRARSVIV